MADVHIDLAALEDLFVGAEQTVDAAMRLQAIRGALLRRAGETTSREDRWKVTAVIRTPETSQAFAILDSIERAAVVRNTQTGLAACRELRAFGSEHGWLGFT